MASFSCFRPTMACLRKARVTIPLLSPTHTKAKIVRFCPPGLVPPDSPTSAFDRNADVPKTTQSPLSSAYVEETEALFVLECSPDLVENGDGTNHLMIVESHDEGDFRFPNESDGEGNQPTIRLNEWYNVGDTIGMIDDGDEDDAEDTEDWLWQAYSYKEGETEDPRLHLPPHIATGKITN